MKNKQTKELVCNYSEWHRTLFSPSPEGLMPSRSVFVRNGWDWSKMHYWGQSESVGFCVRYLCVCVCVDQMMKNSLDRCSLRSIRGSRSSASSAPRRKIHWPVHYRSSEIWSVNFTFHRLQRQSRSMTTERLLQVNTHLRSCAFPLGALVHFFPFFPPTRSAALEVDFF